MNITVAVELLMHGHLFLLSTGTPLACVFVKPPASTQEGVLHDAAVARRQPLHYILYV